MNEASPMSSPETFPDTRNATSSPASVDGHSPQGLPAGPTTANSGPAPHRANRSRSRARSEAPTTSGTCGPTCFASSVPGGPLSPWESRLRQRLARIGSTECMLTWKASATPAGRPLSRLAPSTRPIAATACGLWHTPLARDGDKLDAHLPAIDKRIADGREIGLAMQARLETARALWPTPTSLAPAKDGNNEAGNSAGLVAIRAHALACWPTPTASLADKGVRSTAGAIKEAARSHGPDLAAVAAAAPGAITHGSSGTTEKPGALNPEFVCWLMGFPPEWDACAPTATPSSRKSRRK